MSNLFTLAKTSPLSVPSTSPIILVIVILKSPERYRTIGLYKEEDEAHKKDWFVQLEK